MGAHEESSDLLMPKQHPISSDVPCLCSHHTDDGTGFVDSECETAVYATTEMAEVDVRVAALCAFPLRLFLGEA